MGARDSQRKKVLAIVGPTSPAGAGRGKNLTVEQQMDLIKRISKSQWWKDNCRWGTDTALTASQVNLYGCSSGFRSGCQVGTSAFKTDLEILHSIAHFCTPAIGTVNEHTGEEVTLHGRDYCVTLLSLVGRFLGTERKHELRDAFKVNKVKSTPGRSKEARNAQSMRMKGTDLAKFLESL